MRFPNKYLRNISPYKLASHAIWAVEPSERENILKLDWNEATIAPSPLVKQRIMDLLTQPDFFHTPVSEIMSRNPKTIHKDAKIVEAGEMMNHHSIHTLIVVDDNPSSLPAGEGKGGVVVGVVDSFSCLPGTRFYH